MHQLLICLLTMGLMEKAPNEFECPLRRLLLGTGGSSLGSLGVVALAWDSRAGSASSPAACVYLLVYSSFWTNRPVGNSSVQYVCLS